MRIGALEGGGTKMVLAVCDENGKIYERKSIPTKTPQETMPEMISFFKEQKVEALGIGFFGPLQLNEKAENYGNVTSTPKLAWRDYPVYKEFKDALGVPVGIDTDVNAAALGESMFGASKDTDSSIYITIGTGVGVGVIINGRMLHGMQHPEGGHILINKHPEDNYKGRCPYHENCFEGLACGPAIEERWGKKAIELADNMKVWEIEAYYIAQGLVNIILLLSPEKIILGGGVMHQKQLFSIVRKETLRLLNGYMDTDQLRDIDNYIVEPQLNDNQGIIGCAMIGLEAMKKA